MWFVYLLRCSDNSLYCGITNNLNKRIDTHNKGNGAKYTKTRLPAILVYQELYETKSQALKREYVIKQLNKQQKESLIMNHLDSK
jgi:putative endonuclease